MMANLPSAANISAPPEKQLFQCTELVIDSDTQCLKHLGKSALVVLRLHGSYGVDKILSGICSLASALSLMSRAILRVNVPLQNCEG